LRKIALLVAVLLVAALIVFVSARERHGNNIAMLNRWVLLWIGITTGQIFGLIMTMIGIALLLYKRGDFSLKKPEKGK
jgi:hypothetical protein